MAKQTNFSKLNGGSDLSSYFEFRLGLFPFLPPAFLSAGGGKKATTETLRRPHAAPLIFKCGRQNDGLSTPGGAAFGLPYDIAAVEQIFDAPAKLVQHRLSDRKKGFVQLFKPEIKGYIEIHTKGEHNLGFQRFDHHVTVDVKSISGGFDIDVFPDSQAHTGIELGNRQPGYVIYTEKILAVKRDSVLLNDESLPDSIQNKTGQKGLDARVYVFNRKEIKNQTRPFKLILSDFNISEVCFLAFQKITGKNASRIIFKRKTGKDFAVFLTGFAVSCNPPKANSRRDTGWRPRRNGHGAATGCLFLTFTVIGFLVPLVVLS